MVTIIQGRVVGSVRSVEKSLGGFLGGFVTLQVRIIVHDKAVEGRMARVGLQSLLGYLQGVLEIMIHEQGKCVLQHIVFGGKRSVDEPLIDFGGFVETVIGVIGLGKFPVCLQAIRNGRFQLVQLLNCQGGTGGLVDLRVLQIGLLAVRIEIDGLFVELAGLPHLPLREGYVPFEHRDLRRLVIQLFRHSQILLCIGQLSGIQVHPRYSNQQTDILLVLPFQQRTERFGCLCRIAPNQPFYFVQGPLPIVRRHLSGGSSCPQQCPQNNNQHCFHNSILSVIHLLI